MQFHVSTQVANLPLSLLNLKSIDSEHTTYNTVMDGKTHHLHVSDLAHSNKVTMCYFRVITLCSLTAT
jgi:hypothetical protein